MTTIYKPSETPGLTDLPKGSTRLVAYDTANRRRFAVTGRNAQAVVRAALEQPARAAKFSIQNLQGLNRELSRAEAATFVEVA